MYALQLRHRNAPGIRAGLRRAYMVFIATLLDINARIKRVSPIPIEDWTLVGAWFSS